MPAPKALLKGFEKVVATVKPDPTKRLTISDPDTRGLYLRVTPSGGKTYTIVARNPAGKQVWREIAPADEISLADAREKAREGVKRIKHGLEAFPKAEEPKPVDTFRKVAEDFLALHVKNKERALRSAYEIERQFKVYLYPAWGDRPFVDVRRGDVARLLDRVEQDNGASMADHLLATISKLATWYAARDEDYVSPIIRGMRRTKPSERARERVLDDDEIRAIWKAADGTFGDFIKLCLLTGQRREKVRTMRWQDIADDGTWTIPTEAREKANARTLRLPPDAIAIIKARTPVAENPFVFAGEGRGAFNGLSKGKVRLDEKAAIAAWTIHDLRRTAKSLMGRAGVRPDVSERVLGHALRGVEGVYDRYSYAEEKAEALVKLAGLLALILNPPKGNVTVMERAA